MLHYEYVTDLGANLCQSNDTFIFAYKSMGPNL
jgi:hypothetical protein